MNERFNKFIIFACYFFGIFFSGFILLIEKKNLQIKLNALQAFLFHTFIIVVFVPSMWVGTWIMLNYSKTVGMVFLAAGSVFQIIMAAFWLYTLIQVLRDKTPNLPFIGNFIKNSIKLTT